MYHTETSDRLGWNQMPSPVLRSGDRQTGTPRPENGMMKKQMNWVCTPLIFEPSLTVQRESPPCFPPSPLFHPPCFSLSPLFLSPPGFPPFPLWSSLSPSLPLLASLTFSFSLSLHPPPLFLPPYVLSAMQHSQILPVFISFF